MCVPDAEDSQIDLVYSPEKVFYLSKQKYQSQIEATESVLLSNYGILAGLLRAYKPENINSFKQSSNKLLLAKKAMNIHSPAAGPKVLSS